LDLSIAAEFIQARLAAPVAVGIVAVVTFLDSFHGAIAANAHCVLTILPAACVANRVVFTGVGSLAALFIVGAKRAVCITAATAYRCAGNAQTYLAIFVCSAIKARN
jgi:hypothetical protein